MIRPLLLFWLILLFAGCKSVRPTADSAPSFSLQTIPMPGKSIRALEVLNDSTLFFAANDGQTGFSSDSGKTWQLNKVSFESKAPSFRATAFHADAIFMLSIESPALLYRIRQQGPELVYTERHPDVFYDAMQFFDEKVGIALGDPIDGCFSILRSEDGGASWTKLGCENIPPSIPGEAAYAASNSNLAIQGDKVWFATGGAVSRVFYSDDRGIHWKVVETPVISGGKMTGIYSIDFYNEDVGFVIGGDWDEKTNNRANKALTLDGGKTWQLVADGEGASYKSCVRFVPGGGGKKIIAVGTTGVSYSDDQGKTWQTVHAEGFYTIRFAGKDLAYLAGENKIGLLKLP
jgi:photosystem II stability/assembly factor-like uncharacterized protein